MRLVYNNVDSSNTWSWHQGNAMQNASRQPLHSFLRVITMVEKNPWYHNVNGPYLEWQGPVGIKSDGGGCTRGHGRVGNMVLHRAVCNKDREAIVRAVDQGEDVNEVEGAGNTPLHNAAYEGWVEGAQLLLSLGAKVDASNNAGDRPWHWARCMEQHAVMKLLQQDFFQKECWAHHPKPYVDYMEMKQREDAELAASRKKLIPGMA